jgi:tRNA (mo5U34)-methyltransferase
MIREKMTEEIKREIVRLGPWHHDITVRDGITTRVSLDHSYPKEFGRVSFLDWKPDFVRKMKRIYPNGLEGRSVMDCSCNCGECLFWSKELGAGRCYGSDVREHWINQAQFLMRHREGPKDNVTIEVQDVYDLPKRGLEPFDIVLFHGLFYHLPDPINAVKIAADLCKEVFILSTSTKTGAPEDALIAGSEGTTQVLSGVYGLNWLPGGPAAVKAILDWIGFREFEVLWWQKEAQGTPGWGRMEVVAGRTPGSLDALKGKNGHKLNGS